MKTYPDLDDILKVPLFRGLRLLIGVDTSNAKAFIELIPLLRQMCVDVPNHNNPYDYDERTPSDYYDDDNEDDFDDKGHANFRSAVQR